MNLYECFGDLLDLLWHSSVIESHPHSSLIYQYWCFPYLCKSSITIKLSVCLNCSCLATSVVCHGHSSWLRKSWIDKMQVVYFSCPFIAPVWDMLWRLKLLIFRRRSFLSHACPARLPTRSWWWDVQTITLHKRIHYRLFAHSQASVFTNNSSQGRMTPISSYLVCFLADFIVDLSFLLKAAHVSFLTISKPIACLNNSVKWCPH